MVCLPGEWAVQGVDDNSFRLLHSSGVRAKMLFSTGRRIVAGKNWSLLLYHYEIESAVGGTICEVEDRLSFALGGGVRPYEIAMQRAVGLEENFHYYGWQDVPAGREISMPLMPLYSYAQAWDAQLSGTSLLIRSPEPADTTLVNGLWKRAEDQGVSYRDTWRYGRRKAITTSTITLAVCKNAERNDWINYARDLSRRINNRYGLEPPSLKPYLWLHEETFPSTITEHGIHVQKGITMQEFAKRWLPKLAPLAPARVNIHNVWRNPAETWEGAQLAILSVDVAGTLGGTEGLRDFVKAAHQEELEVMAWFPAALAIRSPLWKAHPEWLLRTQDGGNYTHGYADIQAGDLSGGFGNYLRDSLLKVGRETGLDGIWWDSYLAFPTPVNWALNEPRGMVPDLLQITADLRHGGMQVYLEGAGPLGITAVAILDHTMKRWPGGLGAGVFRYGSAVSG